MMNEKTENRKQEIEEKRSQPYHSVFCVLSSDS